MTDFRYVEQASEEVAGFETVKGERDLLADLAGRLRGRAGFDDAHMSVRTHGKLSEAVGEGVELVPASGLVERLREVKDDGELRAIARRGRAGRRRAPRPCSSAAWPGAPSARWRASSSARCASAGRRTRRSRRSWPPARTARCRTPSRATSRSRAACS